MTYKLPEGWKEVRLEEVARLNPSNYRKDDHWAFVNYLDTGSITNNIIDNISFIDLEIDKLPSRARRRVSDGDVIYSTVRPIQKHLGIIEEPLKNMLVSTGFAVIAVDQNKVNPYYMYLYLTQDPLTNHLQSIAEQRVSTYPALNMSDLKTLNINLPPLREQKAIADTLSALDDKIELNNQINENLEAQAQAIFKHWFIDFEFPDENGNPYKFSGGEMVESELGMIPKGWEIKSLEQLVTGIEPGNWGKADNEGNYTEKVWCMRGTDIPEIKKGNMGDMPLRYVIPRNVDKKSLRNRQVVIEMSGGSPTQSTGRAVYVNQELLDRYKLPLLCTNFCKVFALEDKYEIFFYYYWEYLYRLGYMFSFENGTTGIKNLDEISLLRNTNIAIPPLKNVLNFNEYIKKINKQKISLGIQNQKLSQLRDTLLPKLMSGEIRIPLDKTIEEGLS